MEESYIRRMAQCITRMDGQYYDYARRSLASENEVYVLYTLSDGGEYSQKTICDEWHIPKTTVNAVVAKMKSDGYVEGAGAEGREKLLKLTPKGMEYAKRALTFIHDAEDYALKRTLERFSPAFVDALEAFAAYFTEYGEQKNGN